MKKLIVSMVVSGSVFAHQNLVVDSYFSPYVGADDLIAAHQMVENLQLTKFEKSIFSRTPVLQRMGRFSEMVFYWDPINYASMVMQHEVFGHGYRVRSLDGTEVVKYKIGVPPPYGVGGGSTAYRFQPSIVSVFEMASIQSAGVESTAILANRLRMQWLKGQKVPYSQASLYGLSQQDITYYVLATQKGDTGDISKYAELLTRTYGKKIGSLKDQVLVNLLDPFTAYSLYATWKYIYHGTEASIPMIPMGSYKYLPSFRMGLTPFGPEYYLENFLVKGDSPMYFYLRGGSFTGHRYAGLGIEYPSVWKYNTLSLGFRADAWLQPAVNFTSSRYSINEFIMDDWMPVHMGDSRVGASVSLICQKELWEKGALFLQVGGKSQGYVPGEELSSGLILRVGLTLW